MSNTDALDTPLHFVSHGDSASGKLILFLHGFPELAYSWRKVMPLLAAQGYWCVAVDVPGYGQSPSPDSTTYHSTAARSSDKECKHDDNIRMWCRTHTAHLIAAFLNKLCQKHERKVHVSCLVGHDMGSPQAGALALLYPALFDRVVLMSAPWTGAQPLSEGKTYDLQLLEAQANEFGKDIKKDLEQGNSNNTVVRVLRELAEEGYKHYQYHYCEPNTASSLACENNSAVSFEHALRAYYYLKSGHSWMTPRPLDSWERDQLKLLPGYYLLPPGCSTMQDYLATMISAVDHKDELSLSSMESTMSAWLTKAELQVYVKAFEQTRFQSSLNYYRAMNSDLDSILLAKELPKDSKGQLTMPLLFIAGRHDWGVYQQPGAFEAMRKNGAECVLIDGAGHWVQQEKPEEVVDAILDFLK